MIAARPSRLLSASLLIGTLGSAPVLGFVLLTPHRRWFPEDLPRTVYVDPRGQPTVDDPDHGVTAVMRRIETWEDGLGQDLVRPVAGTPADPNGVPSFSGADGVSTLRFDDPAGICTGSCLAATTTGGIDLVFSDCNGGNWFPWRDSDVVFNTAFTWTTEAETDAEGGCVGEYYLEGVGLHEIGHLLGIGHSEFSIAVMYASVGPCNRVKTNLTADDQAAVLAPYDCAHSRGGVFSDGDGDGAGQDLDCDDQDARVYPGAPELCDYKDSDCDGLGDAAEGLECGDACVLTAAGLGGLEVRKGACVGPPGMGVRRVYVRGALEDMIAAGGVGEVETIACPSFFIYDRVSESSEVAPGASRYYLVRDDADPDFGQASDSTPRDPVEAGCP